MSCTIQIPGDQGGQTVWDFKLGLWGPESLKLGVSKTGQDGEGGELWESPGGPLPPRRGRAVFVSWSVFVLLQGSQGRWRPAACFICIPSIPSSAVRGEAGRPREGFVSTLFSFVLFPAQPPGRPSPLPTEPAYLLLSGACFLSPQPASLNVAPLEHSLPCWDAGGVENAGWRQRRGPMGLGASASLPEVGVRVPSSPALVWARWGPEAQGKSEKH